MTASSYSKPAWAALSIIRSLEGSKSSAFMEFILRDDPARLAALRKSDKGIDFCIAYWKNLIDGGDDAKIKSAVDSYLAELRRSDEDALIARADEIKARRVVQDVGLPTDGASAGSAKVRHHP